MLFILTVSLSCTKEINLPFPLQEPQLVLNGLLCPDQAIQVSLTTTLSSSADTVDFPVVDNAIVSLYEGDMMIGSLTFQDSLYSIDYYPKVGHSYAIEAEVPGYKTVRASDVMPPPAVVSICFREDTAGIYVYSNSILDINITDPLSERNAYWMDTFSSRYTNRVCSRGADGYYTCDTVDTPVLEREKGTYYESFSPIPDRFNAFVDNTSGGVTAYDLYMRIDDANLNGEVIRFNIALGGNASDLAADPSDSSSFQLRILNSSRAYDRYLKSSITHYLAYEFFEEPNPFAEPVKIYSNVENGTGIFAAYNSTSLEIGDFPCP